jgi:hypothetical protein
MKIETLGKRFYLRGDTYAVKDQIRAAGCARPGPRGWPRIYRSGICSDCYAMGDE